MKKLAMIMLGAVLMMSPVRAEALNKVDGVYWYNGHRETYYNLRMDGVLQIMRDQGYAEELFPYWVREDGVKMFGPYVMLAADLKEYPRGLVVDTSLGFGMVCDTGCPAGVIDVAVAW